MMNACPASLTSPIGKTSKHPHITLRTLNSHFEAMGDLKPTLEEQALLRKISAEKLTKDKGKPLVPEQAEKEAKRR